MNKQCSSVEQTLIFDLGMHHGQDTLFYLEKGFNVIALECNPDLIAKATNSFASHIADKRLQIVNRALWDHDDGHVDFFINPEKDDWSSVYQYWAEKGGHASRKITAPTVTLSRLMDDYGVPYYIKCDIEGADYLFCQQLLGETRRPSFVSVEAISLDLLAYLRSAGYDRFQIVNQSLHYKTTAPNPPLEGRYFQCNFDGYMTGLFGRELEKDRWLSFEDVTCNYLDLLRLIRRDPNLATGWFDFHATTSAYVSP